MSHLQGLRRYASSIEKTLSVPEQILIDRNRVNSAGAELADRLGREASDSELADHAGISLKRLAYVRGYRPPVAEGQIGRQARLQGDESGLPAVAVRAADPRHDLAEFLYHDLDPIDQVILERSLGLRGVPAAPQKEIAARLGISAPAVTQRARRIQAQLDELERAGMFW